MSTPQDDKIVPFPQRFRPASEPASHTDDTLLSQRDAIGEDHPIASVRHIRALPLGISTGAFYPELTTEDGLERASGMQVKHVEIMLQTRSEYEMPFAQKLRTTASECGMRIYSVHTRGQEHRMPDVYERRYRDSRDQFRKAIALTVEVGASVLVWHGPDRKTLNSQVAWDAFLHVTDALHAECLDAGILLGIENVSYGALATVRDITRFAPEVTSRPNLGFVFDPFQAVEARANPFMILAAMGNRIVDVHLSDARDSSTSSRHLPPGDGDLPWSALIRAIAGSGYSGPLMVESPMHGDYTTMNRVHAYLDPVFRSVFNFPPGGIDEYRPLLDDEGWRLRTEPPAGVMRGIELFNQREFYRQHEEIEHEWHAESSPLRRLYQGLLQIGVGFYHALNLNYSGAETKLSAGIERVTAFTPQALGIDTARLAMEATQALLELQELGPERVQEFDVQQIPQIHMVQTSES